MVPSEPATLRPRQRLGRARNRSGEGAHLPARSAPGLKTGGGGEGTRETGGGGEGTGEAPGGDRGSQRGGGDKESSRRERGGGTGGWGGYQGGDSGSPRHGWGGDKGNPGRVAKGRGEEARGGDGGKWHGKPGEADTWGRGHGRFRWGPSLRIAVVGCTPRSLLRQVLGPRLLPTLSGFPGAIGVLVPARASRSPDFGAPRATTLKRPRGFGGANSSLGTAWTRPAFGVDCGRRDGDV